MAIVAKIISISTYSDGRDITQYLEAEAGAGRMLLSKDVLRADGACNYPRVILWTGAKDDPPLKESRIDF